MKQQSPGIQNQGASMHLRIEAFILSLLSAFLGYRAGMNNGGWWFDRLLSQGNWFHHYWMSVVVAEACAVSAICILAALRARVGWRMAYKHWMTGVTVLLLLPAQLSLSTLPGAGNVLMR
jgi:hypothetical protein